MNFVYGNKRVNNRVCFPPNRKKEITGTIGSSGPDGEQITKFRQSISVANCLKIPSWTVASLRPPAASSSDSNIHIIHT